MSNVQVKRITVLTSFQEASYGTQSREGSLGPNTADRRSTILKSATAWLFPSSASGPHSHRALEESESLKEVSHSLGWIGVTVPE